GPRRIPDRGPSPRRLRAMGSARHSIDPRTPVLVGVGQHLNRDEPGREPVDLMVEAVRLAVEDTGANGVLPAVDTIAVVPTFSWRYRDPGRLVAERSGVGEVRTWYATVGG